MQIENLASELQTDFLTRLAPRDVVVDASHSSGVSKGFADWLGQEISSVNDQIQTSDSLVQQLAVGEADNLHQVMIALEKAKLQFELVVQVRNKLLEGYQEVMRMQV